MVENQEVSVGVLEVVEISPADSVKMYIFTSSLQRSEEAIPVINFGAKSFTTIFGSQKLSVIASSM